MKQELQEKLFNDFPGMFRGKDKSSQVTAMCWGICCGDGWFQLIYDLCNKIVRIASKDFEVIQVKEKFGGLRFYCAGASEEMFKLISQVENRSLEVCEVCGSDGEEQRFYGLIKTLCEECAKKHESS